MGSAVAFLEWSRREAEFVELQKLAQKDPSPDVQARLQDAFRAATAAREHYEFERGIETSRVPGQL